MTMRAWLLNLDADLELAVGRGYTPGQSTAQQMAMRTAEASRQLLGPADVCVVPGEQLPGEHQGIEGHAFCMTPRARQILEEAGARPVDAPAVEVLAKVNHRGFCASLGQCLRNARFAHSLAEVVDAVETSDRAWLLKRPYSVAGKGQRRIFGSRLDEEDRRWIQVSLHEGDGAWTPERGLQLEPFVQITLELNLHGMVGADGSVQLGAPVIQICDDRGAWKGTRPAEPSEILQSEADALMEEALRVARALTEEGYFGPFGIDAFRFTDDGGEERFNPRSEINARYTMGWSFGDLVANDSVLE